MWTRGPRTRRRRWRCGGRKGVSLFFFEFVQRPFFIITVFVPFYPREISFVPSFLCYTQRVGGDRERASPEARRERWWRSSAERFRFRRTNESPPLSSLLLFDSLSSPFSLEKEAHTYHSAAEPESSPASPSRRGPRNQDGGHQAAELGQAADDNAFVFDGGADGGGGGADVALPSRWRCFSASSPPQPSLILRCCCSVS